MLDVNRIKTRRAELGLTLEAAAIAAGWGKVGRSRWHDIEVGRRRMITLKSLGEMARALKCSPISLLLASGDE